MNEPFELVLRNINLTADEVYDEDDEVIYIGDFTTHIQGKLEPGCLIKVYVDSEFDMTDIEVLDEGEEEGYIFRSEHKLLPFSTKGNVLVWNDRDYGSVVAVLKNELPDMTFEE